MKRNKIIISPDYDGYLSFFLFKKYFNKDAYIFGRYQTYQKEFDGTTNSVLSLTNENFKKEEMLAIDLDINYIDSLGHHFLLSSIVKGYEGNKHTNFNLEIENLVFYQKCPFSTVMLLLYFSEQFKNDLNQLFIDKEYNKIAFLLYADNFILLFKRYSKNVKFWMYKKNLMWLFNLIDENYDEILKESLKIQEDLVNNHHFVRSKTDYYSQSVIRKFEQDFLNYLAICFGFEPITLEFNYKKKFQNVRVSMSEVDKYSDIFSHAVIDKDTVSISIGKL